LVHGGQAHGPGGPGKRARVEPWSLVAHRQPDLARVLLEADQDAGTRGVTEGVVEGLLSDPEQGQLDARRQPGLASVSADLDRGAVGSLERVDQVAQRRLQAVALQALRTKRLDEGPHLLERLRGPSLEAAQRGPGT